MDLTLNAKDRFKKVAITDVAIAKIPEMKYIGLTDAQNRAMRKLAQAVLLRSQQRNNSNEVAVVVSLENEDLMSGIGFANGDEHGVDVCAFAGPDHLIKSGKTQTVAIIHNHPSTQTLSTEDIFFFLHYESLKIMAVVTNQGVLHYLLKDKDFAWDAARNLLKECTEGLTEDSPAKEHYAASLDFLVHCSEVGLYYR